MKKLFKTPSPDKFEEMSLDEKAAVIKDMEKETELYWSISKALTFGVIALNVISTIKAFRTNNLGDLFISMLFINIMSINFIATKLIRDHHKSEDESYHRFMKFAISSEKFISILTKENLEYKEKLKAYENTGGSN